MKMTFNFILSVAFLLSASTALAAKKGEINRQDPALSMKKKISCSGRAGGTLSSHSKAHSRKKSSNFAEEAMNAEGQK